MTIRTLCLATTFAVAGISAAFAQSSILDGIYTEEQAAVGQAVYADNCSSCHAGTLRGTPGGPGLIGVRFTLNWADKSVGELYSYIRDNMPAGLPGTLSDDEYAQVTAYILQQNEYPASDDAELGTDVESLDEIIIERIE